MDMEHIVIHKGTDYHCAFPDIMRIQNGDLVAVFREAPARPGTGVPGEANERYTHNHLDAESRISLVRSADDGRTWDPASRVVIDASDGNQDINMPTIAQLASGELVVNNHRWDANVSEDQAAGIRAERHILARPPGYPFMELVFDSMYLMRSEDQGATWSRPKPFGIPSLAYASHTGKSGVMEMPDGSWLLPVSGTGSDDDASAAFVVRSQDGGQTWAEPSRVAHDPRQVMTFGEHPLVRAPSGRLLTVMRTGGADGYLYQAFSEDEGWIWQGLKPTQMWGHPCHLLRLRSGRILCAYGYRREPFGVRATISDDEGETWDMAHEIVIREDGLHRDLGYPASVQLQDDRILTIYYFHGEDGIRHIAGSIYGEPE